MDPEIETGSTLHSSGEYMYCRIEIMVTVGVK